MTISRKALTIAGLAVIAGVLLAGFAFVYYRGPGRNDAALKAARSDFIVLAAGIETFKSDVGRYPTDGEGLGALLQRPPASELWNGPYVKALPQDPWFRHYVYRRLGDHYQLLSYGSDGKPGGTGSDADINATQRELILGKVFSDFAELDSALMLYRQRLGRYPSDAEGVAALGTASGRAVSADPWGRPYVYRNLGDRYELLSYGADGREGGVALDADISRETIVKEVREGRATK